jgi:hypothetical protein
MDGQLVHISDLDDLRAYVQRMLCEQNELEENVFPTTEKILVRRGQACGIFFCLHGPRSVKFTAIWETDRNTILFYASSGERLHKTQLANSPSLRLQVA